MNEDLNHNTQTQFDQPEEKVQPTEVKNNNFLVTLLSVLLLLACLIAGFFAWQTQNLVKELTEYRSQNLTTPTTPSTQSPTEGWKEIVSKEKGFSFKIPDNFVTLENKDSIEIFLDQSSLDKSKTCKLDKTDVEPLPCSPFLLNISYKNVPKDNYKNGEEYVNQVQGGMGGNPPYQTIKGQGLTWTVGQASGVEIRPTIRAFAYEGNKLHFIETNTYILPFWNYLHNSSSNNIDWGVATSQTDWTKVQDLSYQIISTIKFIEPQASTEPVACTMDAKICPDGSSVGRIAPNCEFAPCPTPKP